MKLFIRAVIIGDIDAEQVPEITANSLDSFNHNPFMVFAEGWEIEVGTTSDLAADALPRGAAGQSAFYLDCWPETDLPWQEITGALDKLRQGFEAAGARLAWQLVDQNAD